MEKTIWMLEGLCDALELDLARRIGDVEAARYCISIKLSLRDLRELKRKLDCLDELELEAPEHRQWRPYPEV